MSLLVRCAARPHPAPLHTVLLRTAPHVQFNFETRIWHPNIDAETGKPCVDLVTCNWKPTSTIGDILNLIRELLAAPNASDSVNAAAAGEMHDDIEKFHAHAKAEADAYATA